MSTQANSQGAKSLTQTPAQASPAATPPQQRLVVSKCSINRTDIVKVLRPTGIYYAYEYSQKQNHMIPHVCTCQPKVTEASLQPLYSTNSVLFVFNTVTQSIEQYNYNFETDTFEQLENTGLIYNPALVRQSYLIVTLVGPRNEQVLLESNQNGSLRKQAVNDGGYKIMASSKVLTSMAKSLASREYSHNTISRESYPEESIKYDDKDDSESESDEDQEYKKYIGLISPFVRMTCAHSSEVIIAFNYTTEQYESFSYSDTARKFIRLECNCSFDVMERDLIPKYGEYGADKKQFVIHVHNLYTNLVEQYVYDADGFKQVHHPELIYNASKANNSSIVLCIQGEVVPMIVLMRDSNGRFKKEKFSLEQSSYVPLAELPVQTFLVQRKEAAKKKKDAEKAKKRAQRAQEQVVEKPEVVVKPVEAPKEAPVAKDATARREKAVGKTDKTPRAVEPVDAQRVPVVEPVETLTKSSTATQRAASQAKLDLIIKKTKDSSQRLSTSEGSAQSSGARGAIVKEDDFVNVVDDDIAHKPIGEVTTAELRKYMERVYGTQLSNGPNPTSSALPTPQVSNTTTESTQDDHPTGSILDAVKNTLSAARALRDAKKDSNDSERLNKDSTDTQKSTAHKASEDMVPEDVYVESVEDYIAQKPGLIHQVNGSQMSEAAKYISANHTPLVAPAPNVNKPARNRVIRLGPMSDEVKAELRSIAGRFQLE